MGRKNSCSFLKDKAIVLMFASSKLFCSHLLVTNQYKFKEDITSIFFIHSDKRVVLSWVKLDSNSDRCNEGCIAAHPDKAADKEMADLKVFCPNKVNGCTWREKFKFLQVSLFLIYRSLVPLVSATFFLTPCMGRRVLRVHACQKSTFPHDFNQFFLESVH